ncbi:heterokaryon incompatibility protein-domain-containing protein [Exophiala viscosa]|uniref:Heterokaryon incompatibility protein-domain-containing protein n=1 Tax=Exophiala viscosa TaxID=2486360 RepID=A0AAN6E5N0_9EURO|nr:heterokaryon incompatibility protein-domain-containing protein [Exophiala viscosa]
MSTVTNLDVKNVTPRIPSAPHDYYQYATLPDTGWMRVLILHPGSGSLSCSLRCQKIEEAALDFEALSYVWGSDVPQDASDIECDSHVLKIRPNLASALLHIRNAEQPRYLFVDAICINQEDEEERSLQVQQMGDIYASASNVLIWIGSDSDGEANECLRLIETTSAALANMIEHYEAVEHIPPIEHGSGLICFDSDKWDMVRRLMDSEWFTRVWVLQEVGLARSAVLLYGKSRMNWSYLVELMLCVASRADVASCTGNIKSGIIWDAFEDIWRSFGNAVSWRNELPLSRSVNSRGGHTSLINILNDGRVYQATDQRDRVYAFLSHPSAYWGAENPERVVIADYRKSVDDVYLEAASTILEYDPYAWTTLTCVDHAPNCPSLCGQRPSWVPRWDEGWRVYWLGYPEMWYRAGGNDLTAFQISISNSELHLSGVVMDSIDWSSRTFDAEELRLEPQKREAPIQSLWQELEKSGSTTVYGDDNEYAYSLVLVAGRASDDGPAEDNHKLHRSVYQAYKEMLHGCDHEGPTASSSTKGSSYQRQELRETIEVETLTYISNQRRALHSRRVFRTSKGYYGIGHSSVEVGDVCCVFKGVNVPLIIRKVAGDVQETAPEVDEYILVGESYVQGIMKGEVFEMIENEAAGKDGELVQQEIVLV